LTWPDYRDDLVVCPDVRYANDVIGAVAEVLRDRGSTTGMIGVSGSEFLSWAHYTDLKQRLPAAELTPADEVLDNARMIKSEAEFEMLRTSGRIGADAFEAMMSAVEPGKTEADAVAAAVDVITRAGGALYTALVASGPHDSALVWSALPGYDSSRPLQEGEIFHVDMYAPICGGYLIDYSRSTVVGGNPTEAQREVLEASVGAVDAVIAAIEPGATATDLARAGETFLDENGYRWSDASSATRDVARNDLNFPAWGHGFGLTWEPPWLIEGDTTPITPGMCLAIERHVGSPGVGTAAFEQNVIVHNDGAAEVLSTARVRWW
jgi:Xaa-Pro dipeptidase